MSSNPTEVPAESLFRLDGKRILVTGASSGLGRETAVLLSQLGATLLLVARDEVRLAETAARLIGAGHRTEVLDLLGDIDIARWMKNESAEQGRLAGVVHAAGVQNPLPLRMLDEQKWNAVQRLNTTLAMLLVQGLRQRPVVAAPASVVFLSSVMGLAGQPALAAYSASKGALIAMSRSLALELAPERIRVNCVAPGVVQTEMAEKLWNTIGQERMEATRAQHPLGFGTPRDVACAVAYLLSDASRWITGTTLVVDGGYVAH